MRNDEGRRRLYNVDRYVKMFAKGLDLGAERDVRIDDAESVQRCARQRLDGAPSRRKGRTSGSPPHSAELRTLATYCTNSSSVIMPSFVAPAASSPPGLARNGRKSALCASI